MPPYFHYLEETGELNQLIDRFAKRLLVHSSGLVILRGIAEEQDPPHDRPLRLA